MVWGDLVVTSLSGVVKDVSGDYVEGTLAWAIAHANDWGKTGTIRIADGLFTGGTATIMLNGTVEIAAGANITLLAGAGHNLVIQVGNVNDGAEPGRWYANGYQKEANASAGTGWNDADAAGTPNDERESLVASKGYSIFETKGDATLSLSNVTLEGGHLVGGNGTAISAGGSLDLTLEDVIIARGIAEADGEGGGGLGGAIYVDGDLTLTMAGDTQIAVNAASEGGAIYVTGKATVTGDGIVGRNEARVGRGGAIAAGGDIKFAGDAGTADALVFASNTAETDGGALAVDGGARFVFTDVVFALNEAGKNGGAVRIDTGVVGAEITVADSLFVANTADGTGGAVYAEVADANNLMSVADSTFLGNAAGEAGGAIRYVTKGTLADQAEQTVDKSTETRITASNSTFDRNKAGTAGGAIANDYGRVTVKGGGSLLENNRAGTDGGAIANSGAVTVGKGVAFADNTAGRSGGALAVVGGSASVTGAAFEGNFAAKGGAIAVTDEAVTVTVLNTTFTVNAATVLGGALFVDGQATLVNRKSTFAANTASAKGGKGGAVAVAGNGSYVAANNTYLANRAEEAGGALYVSADDPATAEKASVAVTRSSFYDNNAVGRGGAVAQDGGESLLTDVIFAESGNTTSRGLGNFAERGGAIALTGGKMELVSTSNGGTSFTGNTASKDGGAIYVKDAELAMSGKGSFRFAGNVADAATGKGGAIAIEGASDVRIDSDVTIVGDGDSARAEAAQGGAIYVGDTSSLEMCGDLTVSGVEASKDGGAVYLTGEARFVLGDGRMTVNAATAKRGSAFYVDSSEAFTLNPAAVDVSGNTGYGTYYFTSRTEAHFEEAAFSANGEADYLVTAGYLAVNRSSFDGAGICVEAGYLAVNQSSFIHGAGIRVEAGYLAVNQSSFIGGGIHVEAGGQFALANSTIADSGDWGVRVDAGGAAAIVNATVARNALGGLKADGDVLVLNSIIVGNTGTDIVGTTRGGVVYYGTAEGTVEDEGGRNRSGRNYGNTFTGSGLHTAENGTQYFVVQQKSPAQESGSRVSGGTDGTYVDRHAGTFTGVPNRYVEDLDYDQRGKHRYVNSFGAVIEVSASLDENSTSNPNNTNYTSLLGLKGGGLPPQLGEVLSQQADVREAANKSTMGYGTVSGRKAFVTPASVQSVDDQRSAYSFPAIKAEVLLGDDLRDALGNEALGESSIRLQLDGLADFASKVFGSSEPVGGLTRIRSLQLDYEKALEELTKL